MLIVEREKSSWSSWRQFIEYHISQITCSDRKNLREIANRMFRLAYGQPCDFSFQWAMQYSNCCSIQIPLWLLSLFSYSDAIQMIFSMHCCLHLCGQPVSVGRLDQLLIDYYNRDIEKGTLTPEQVIIITSVIHFIVGASIQELACAWEDIRTHNASISEQYRDVSTGSLSRPGLPCTCVLCQLCQVYVAFQL